MMCVVTFWIDNQFMINNIRWDCHKFTTRALLWISSDSVFVLLICRISKQTAVRVALAYITITCVPRLLAHYCASFIWFCVLFLTLKTCRSQSLPTSFRVVVLVKYLGLLPSSLLFLPLPSPFSSIPIRHSTGELTIIIIMIMIVIVMW